MASQKDGDTADDVPVPSKYCMHTGAGLVAVPTALPLLQGAEHGDHPPLVCQNSSGQSCPVQPMMVGGLEAGSHSVSSTMSPAPHGDDATVTQDTLWVT